MYTSGHEYSTPSIILLRSFGSSQNGHKGTVLTKTLIQNIVTQSIWIFKYLEQRIMSKKHLKQWKQSSQKEKFCS